MCTLRLELLTIISLLTTSSRVVNGFTTSSLFSRSSFTAPVVLNAGKRLSFNRKNRNIHHDRTLFCSSILESASPVNDTLATSDVINTESFSEQQQSIEIPEIIYDSTTEQLTKAVSELVNPDSSPELQALMVLNDNDLEDLVSAILPPSSPTTVEDITSPEIAAESSPSPDPPIIGENTLAEPMNEVSQLISTKKGTMPPSDISTDMPSTSLPTTISTQQEEESNEVNNIPNVRTISRFAIAALGVWLCSPILSLIDTSAVGLLSGTAQQAALNPAVSVTEYTALLIAFMYTGTTNLIASAQEDDRVNQSQSKTADAFRASLQLSSFVGMFLAIAMLFSASTLLRLIIGKNNTGLDPVIFSAALKYVRIRALGMPAAVITGSAQAACLGMKDTRSPLLILVMAASINLIGDLVLVGNGNAWIGGAAGAAWATVFSQYAALFMFLSWLTKSNSKKNVDNFEPKFQTKSPLKKLQNIFNSKEKTKGNSSTNITKGLLAGKMWKRNLLQFPPMSIAKQFWPYFLPVTTTSAGRVSAYVSMAHVISSAIGTSAMAAQQIILSFFFCLCPVADALNLTAQSFVPAFMQRRGNAMENAKAIRKLSLNIMKTSLFFVVGTLGVVASMPFTTRFFTSDPVVLSQVRSITPFVATWFSYHAISMAAEGILLGRKDLAFLGKAYAGYFFIIPIIYLKIKAASLAGIKTATLASVWQVFIIYGFSRFVIWNLRLIQQTLKTMNSARKSGVNNMNSEEETIFG